jgi:ubiquinone/menaquinone biosynthesis C-methylase UbiE
MITHMRRWSFITALVLSAFVISPGRAQDTWQDEADRLAILLNWQQGSVVAEIGAGKGKLTLAAAKRVGMTGRVYTTELDPSALANLRELALKENNITVLQAAETETNLPRESCDSIFMRLIYHHLTKPVEIDTSLFQSIKPGGLLAVIDEEPVAGTKIPEGVPKNRGGHGVPQNILIDELKATGFKVVTIRNEWPNRDEFHPIYVVVLRKP